MLAYRLLVHFFRVALRVFFRRVEIVGLEHVPEDGPVIFCGNHPNSLLDPALITVSCGRVVHFAASSMLFRSRLLRPILHAMGAVPIHRRMDHGGGKVDNTSAFDSLFDVLAKGRGMGIFPEGLSHDQSQLQRLRSGAARIALGLAARHPDQTVRVVPCGLYYSSRHRWRSCALVQFGPALDVEPATIEAFEADPREAARAFTERIEEGLRALTVNAADWDTIRVLDGVRRLYQPSRISLHDRVELARRFNRVYPSVAEQPAVRALYGRVAAYLERLAELGLDDRDVRRPLTQGQLGRRLVGQVALTLVWLPLALLGSPFHVPVLLTLYLGSERLAPRKDAIATTKFLLGLLLLVGLYFALIAGAWALTDWRGAIGMAVMLPLTGYATLLVLARFGAIDRKLSALLGAFLLARELAELRQTRDALERDVVTAVERFIPEDMVPLFPREPSSG